MRLTSFDVITNPLETGMLPCPSKASVLLNLLPLRHLAASSEHPSIGVKATLTNLNKLGIIDYYSFFHRDAIYYIIFSPKMQGLLSTIFF
jgi:hypothetical protein